MVKIRTNHQSRGSDVSGLPLPLVTKYKNMDDFVMSTLMLATGLKGLAICLHSPFTSSTLRDLAFTVTSAVSARTGVFIHEIRVRMQDIYSDGVDESVHDIKSFSCARQ